jgi:outer membrane lipoprotein-sorting protein
MKMEMSMTMQGMNMQMVRYQRAPDKFAMIIRMQGNVVQRQVYDGEKGLSSGMQGRQEITGDDLKKLKLEATLNRELKYDKLGYEMELASIEDVDGKQAYKVIMTSPYGDKTIDYYDVKSGLKIKSEQTISSQMGTINQETYFDDYKEIEEGYIVPHTLTQNLNGQTIEITVENVEINANIDDTIFEIDQ